MAARPRGGGKPLDVGTGVVCASFAGVGTWLSLGTLHPRHGFVELTGMPVFDESARGRPELVRRYRALMTDPRHAFLVLETVPAERPLRAWSVPLARRPRQVALYEGWSVASIVDARRGERRVSHELRFRQRVSELAQRRPHRVRLLFSGRLALPTLAMVTPTATGEPAPVVGNETAAHGSALTITAPDLDVTAVIRATSAAAGEASWVVSADAAQLELAWPAGHAELGIAIECEIRVGGTGGTRGGPHADRAAAVVDTVPSSAVEGRPNGRRLPATLPSLPLPIPDALRPALDRMAERGLRYVRECTALQLIPGRVAILTDHRLLPLSWTRDAYYQALPLLAGASAHETDVETVADHLRWLWLSCARPAATWARSHHGDGRRKDEVYQADQQIYPLLELADFWQETGRLPELFGPGAEGTTWAGLVSEVVADLTRRLEAGHGLLATDENAADDPVGQPFLLATQVLLWYVFGRLAEMSPVLPLEQPLQAMAETLRATVAERFLRPGPAGAVWAYAVDGRGGSSLYHDANDLPTVFAPVWGFCSADDPAWRRTIDFAFSAQNPAYAAGPWGGLGSRHTAGSWSLGLIQEWLARGVAGQHEAAEEALRRLVGCACADGSLPEASDPASGRLGARHWFAWPGALLAALLGAGS